MNLLRRLGLTLLGFAAGVAAWVVMIVLTGTGPTKVVERGTSLNLWDTFLLLVFSIGAARLSWEASERTE